jgi:hypothetical protein
MIQCVRPCWRCLSCQSVTTWEMHRCIYRILADGLNRDLHGYFYFTQSKGKIIPVSKVKLSRYTPWKRLGETRYSSYAYLTSALDGGESWASRPGRALPQGKGPPVPIGQDAGWAPEPVWTQRLEVKSSASVGDRTLVVQSVVSHYTDWATAAQDNTGIKKNQILYLFYVIRKLYKVEDHLRF